MSRWPNQSPDLTAVKPQKVKVSWPATTRGTPDSGMIWTGSGLSGRSGKPAARRAVSFMPSGEGAEGDGVKGGVGLLAAEADEGIVCLVAFESIGRQ